MTLFNDFSLSRKACNCLGSTGVDLLIFELYSLWAAWRVVEAQGIPYFFTQIDAFGLRPVARLV
jgi:hypothetical protein